MGIHPERKKQMETKQIEVNCETALNNYGFDSEYSIGKDIVAEISFEKGTDYFEEGEGTIFHFEVREEYKRRGIGTLILKRALEMIKKEGLNHIKILMHDCQKKGHDLFLIKMGFKNLKAVMEGEKYLGVEADYYLEDLN